MTDEPQTPPAAPAAPTTSAEASARLATLTADPAWGARVLSGADADATREFKSLTEMQANGTSDVDVAMRGELPDIPDSGLKQMAGTAEFLRDNGFTPLAIKETLERKETSQADFNLATALKAQNMRSPEFVRAFLSGEPAAVRAMLAIDVVLSSAIKKASAA